MPRLHNGQPFPPLKVPAVGGGTISLPDDLADSKPFARTPLAGTKHTWICRLICPSTLDARSPQVGGL